MSSRKLDWVIVLTHKPLNTFDLANAKLARVGAALETWASYGSAPDPQPKAA
jgi:hypothetical protein